MPLVPFDDAHLATLMTWFPDADACLVWGGAEFVFPFTDETFRRDSRVEELPSFVLVDDGTLAGFGQYYRRNGRCHLARLAIAPDQRGLGHGTTLIRELCDRGGNALRLDTYSLFVLAHNRGARRLYERLGFREAPYPQPLPDAHVYMIADGPLQFRAGREAVT